jgi:hypothetical protein
MSDQPVAETSVPDNTQQSQETDNYDHDGIRTRNPRSQGTADLTSDRVATSIGYPETLPRVFLFLKKE